ncbi:MAG: hypothetical protein Q3M24_19100 [Candidatus Electrothrix aestuarii]|uniref:FecR protein domain-containing protein n=1 Tax=Candidatus Electrothrix aestuarii TaxID=3062594 RepID=A0AAU8LSV7_9BACT
MHQDTTSRKDSILSNRITKLCFITLKAKFFYLYIIFGHGKVYQNFFKKPPASHNKGESTMKRKTLSAYVLAALMATGFASSQVMAGVLAEGNISVYKGGKQVNTLTGQNPVDEEALLICNDQCMVKTTGVSIIGTAGSELAVKDSQKQFNLLLKKGKLDFVLTGSVGKMGFYTADRQYASADVVYNVSSSSPVRGYMELTPSGDTKIGVYAGRLVFNSAEGTKTIDSNNYILLAQADVGAPATDASEEPAVADDNGDWECNSDNAGRLCDKDNEDWYCGDENMGEKCGDRAGAIAWGTDAIVAGSAVAAVAAWGVYEYLDDDDDTPRVTTIPPSQTPSGTAPNDRASSNATPPASPRNPSPNL